MEKCCIAALHRMRKMRQNMQSASAGEYTQCGRDYVLNDRDIIGIFNLETTTVSPRGREFLNYAQKNGAVVSLSDDLPQCYVLADAPVDTVYLSELSSAAMKRRTEMSF